MDLVKTSQQIAAAMALHDGGRSLRAETPGLAILAYHDAACGLLDALGEHAGVPFAPHRSLRDSLDDLEREGVVAENWPLRLELARLDRRNAAFRRGIDSPREFWNVGEEERRFAGLAPVLETLVREAIETRAGPIRQAVTRAEAWRGWAERRLEAGSVDWCDAIRLLRMAAEHAVEALRVKAGLPEIVRQPLFAQWAAFEAKGLAPELRPSMIPLLESLQEISDRARASAAEGASPTREGFEAEGRLVRSQVDYLIGAVRGLLTPDLTPVTLPEPEPGLADAETPTPA